MRRADWHLRAHVLVLAWGVAAAAVALAHRWAPASGWLMVHLLLLGAASTAILVWSQHFADTLIRRAAPRRALLVRLAVHTGGALLVVAGVVGRWTPAVVLGGALVAGAAVDQAVRIARQSRGGLPTRFGHLARYYVAAGALLVPGVACGVLMARFPVGPELHGRLAVAHVALSVLGWIGVTVAGTLVVLWPTVLHVRIDDPTERAARRALPVLVAGVLVLAAGALAGVPAAAGLGAAVVVAGIGLLAVPLARLVRGARAGTFAVLSLAAAVAWWVGSTVALGVRVVAAPSWEAAAAGVSALTPALVVGFAAQVLVGSLSQLLPVVLGGGPAVSRETSGLLNRAAEARVVLLNGALALFLAPAPSLVRVGVSVVGLGALVAFLVLAARAVLTARRLRADAVPGVAPLPAPARRDAAGGPADPVAGARRRGAAGVAVAGLLGVVVLGVGLDPAAAGLTSGVVAAAGDGAPVAATGRTTTVDVEAQDMRFVPDRVEVPAGDRLVIRVTNADAAVHDLVLANGATSGRLGPGESADVDAGVVGADLDGWCSVAGHRLMGMTLDVVVTGGAAAADGTDGAGGADEGAGATDHAAMGHGGTGDGAPSAAEDVDLSGTAGTAAGARDAVLPPLPETGPTTRRVTLRVQEQEQEVAPGVVQTVWTFGGTAPGPVLHGRVGDTFEITLVNDGSIGHSVDFHAGSLAPDDVMRTIAPGETLTYTFTATRSGIWMYHCSTMPMSLHIANGMAGAVVIEPAGLPEVDRQYVLVQSELYLGPQGGTADEQKLLDGAADLVVFNGVADQYRHEPLPAAVGERVRVWVLDAGPSRASAFHVVGGQFDSVFREGDWTLRDGGSTGTGGAQVLALQPAEGGFVELTFPEAGHYPFVSHVMTDAERGARGVFEVAAAP
ncbi:multicopper oxidase domain-containing protein [Cellulomonas sp.]|uniref:multicopper oxidase domain-containing protein n=1 Tax=Cellulomonas sp. TaxID=40001 RepID=UPI002D486A7B|nr:multicopper oxidase domain-containing protein [Cellulomonas sp.]HYQ73589.1 multicopper oxidase domain-containing protein [Cellulomonas sp.]